MLVFFFDDWLLVNFDSLMVVWLFGRGDLIGQIDLRRRKDCRHLVCRNRCDAHALLSREWERIVGAPSFQIGHCLSNLLIAVLIKINRLTESFGLDNWALKLILRSRVFFGLNRVGNFGHWTFWASAYWATIYLVFHSSSPRTMLIFRGLSISRGCLDAQVFLRRRCKSH
jgi:hypothetical protein